MAHSFVSIKAFGDLVIAVTSLQRVMASGSDHPAIIVGSHLVELLAALESDISAHIIDVKESGVPSIYDIKKNGMLRALRSAVLLRKIFSDIDDGATLIFDRAAWREKFLGAGRPISELPQAPNIYLAYSKLLTSIGMVERHCPAGRPQPAKHVGIFPGSRIAAKNIPGTVIGRTLSEIDRAGYKAHLMLLEGERPDLENSDFHFQIVPRRFADLARAVRSMDMVISADSLPAHLAERSNKPVFVLTPVENSYWLPLSSFEQGYWTLFENDLKRSKLSRFLEQNA